MNLFYIYKMQLENLEIILQCIAPFMTCFRKEIRTCFVEEILRLEEDLKADAGPVSQQRWDESHEGLLVTILWEVMFPDLNIENIVQRKAINGRVTWRTMFGLFGGWNRIFICSLKIPSDPTNV